MATTLCLVYFYFFKVITASDMNLINICTCNIQYVNVKQNLSTSFRLNSLLTHKRYLFILSIIIADRCLLDSMSKRKLDCERRKICIIFNNNNKKIIETIVCKLKEILRSILQMKKLSNKYDFPLRNACYMH